MKLHKKVEHTISVLDMKDGQVAEIVEWPAKQNIGRIIQRYKDVWITLGKPSRQAFILGEGVDENWLVRILPPGTLLEI